MRYQTGFPAPRRRVPTLAPPAHDVTRLLHLPVVTSCKLLISMSFCIAAPFLLQLRPSSTHQELQFSFWSGFTGVQCFDPRLMYCRIPGKKLDLCGPHTSTGSRKRLVCQWCLWGRVVVISRVLGVGRRGGGVTLIRGTSCIEPIKALPGLRGTLTDGVANQLAQRRVLPRPIWTGPLPCHSQGKGG